MQASASRSEQQQGAIRVVRETDHIVAVCLEGDFDLTNAADLDDRIHQALDRGYDVILDLSEATFIDSSIIRVLMRATRAAGRRERVVVMQLGTATTVERVLELVRIEHVLPRAHDRHEAVRMTHHQAQRRGCAHSGGSAIPVEDRPRVGATGIRRPPRPGMAPFVTIDTLRGTQ